ncbi:MAG: type II toxin-antitoxin system HigB family toxin [Terriglobales bacterium]
MHIISRKRLKEAATRHGDLEAPLDVWFRIVKRASWRNLADVRKTFASADFVNRWTVFNLKGNRYRLVTEINYRFQRVYIRHVLTHTDYDREEWKQ